MYIFLFSAVCLYLTAYPLMAAQRHCNLYAWSKWPLTWPSPSINPEKLGKFLPKVALTVRCTIAHLSESHADKPCTLSPYLRVRPTTRYTLTCAYCGYLSRVKPATPAYSPLNPNTLLGSYARGTSRTLPLIYES